MPYPAPSTHAAAAAWAARRTVPADDLPDARALLEHKHGARISVGIPARNEAGTIGDICAVIQRELIERAPLVDELVVIDGDSIDETSLRARAAGARVVDARAVLPHVAVVPGKGESLWRSLGALSGDVVVWVDGDIENFEPHFVTRLVAPLLLDPSVDFVKAYYRRPLRVGEELLPDGGGRITELLVRPLLALLFPELAAFAQPCSGEYAGRAAVLRRLPFLSGYSVEVALLIDLLAQVGLERLAQVDLGTRVHRNRPLAELAPTALAIARTILRRAEEHGRLTLGPQLLSHPLLQVQDRSAVEVVLSSEIERPPLDSVAGSASAATLG